LKDIFTVKKNTTSQIRSLTPTAALQFIKADSWSCYESGGIKCAWNTNLI